MSSTVGPNTASIGSMRSIKPRVRAVPAVQTFEIQSIQSIEGGNTERTRSIYSRNTANTLKYSNCRPGKYFALTPTRQTSLSVSCKNIEMKLSKWRTDGPIIFRTPSTLRMLRVFWYCE